MMPAERLLKLCLDIQAINRSIEQKQFSVTLNVRKQRSVVRKYLRNLEGKKKTCKNSNLV